MHDDMSDRVCTQALETHEEMGLDRRLEAAVIMIHILGQAADDNEVEDDEATEGENRKQ
jgi:hypothetical protein